MKKKLRIFLPLMLLVMALTFVMTACGDSDGKDKDDDEDSTPKYEQPIEAYFNAIKKGSGKELKKCFCQEEIDACIEASGEDYYDELAENLNSSFKRRFGDDARLSYKVKGKDKLDDDDLEQYSQEISRRAKNEDIKVKEGYKVKVKITIESKSNSDSDEENDTLYVGKIGGKWVLLDV